MSIPSLQSYLELKAAEYAPFDPLRFPALYQRFLTTFPSSSLPKVIQVVGTNGKGSTGRFLALMLQAAGHTVGHFTSPHIHEFRERFWINGGVVSNAALKKAHQALWERGIFHEASYFEYATLLALYVFEGLEFWVIEAGLGGEFDSTTALRRDLSLFTPIGIDHEELLGKGLEAIALTKLKSMAPWAILGKQYDLDSIKPLAQRIANERSSSLCILEDERMRESDTLREEAYFSTYPLPLYQRWNWRLAARAMEWLGVEWEVSKIPPLDLAGRMERHGRLILDVGHNPQAARALLETLQGKPFELIYNTYKDKNYREILATLRPYILKLHLMPLEGNPRLVDPALLEACAKELGVACERFQGELDPLKDYLVFGSFSVIGAFKERYLKEYLKQLKEEDER